MKDTYLNTQSSLAMKSAGYYSAKTAGAKNVIDKTQKVINIENVKLEKEEK